LLAKNFKNYSPEAIKKYRQRMAKAGYSNDEITREIFKRHGLSYESSGNPLEDADFSPKYYKKLSQAYRVSGGGLTRIAFEIAWLQEQIKKLEKDQSEIFNLTVEGLGEVESSLLHRLGELHWDLRDAREREAKLTLLKVKQDIENTDPETACGALIKDMLSQGITTFEKNKLAAAL